jgi:hypothetical protein
MKVMRYDRPAHPASPLFALRSLRIAAEDGSVLAAVGVPV